MRSRSGLRCKPVLRTTHCEWEIYRARLLSLRAKTPPVKLSDAVKKSLTIDIEYYKGGRYKALDDLLDGIFCAYLAYHFWYWGESWVIGDTDSGYVTLPKCVLPNCSLRNRGRTTGQILKSRSSRPSNTRDAPLEALPEKIVR
jgi:predicted RNase H-like nuclease